MSEPGIVDADLGRRERKKLETREALFRAAVQLFSARGVDETTVEDIADAVDVSARTFHRYFPSKEDVLFFDSADRRRRFAEALAARPDDEALLDSLRIAAHDLVDAFLGDPDDDRRRLLLIRSSVTLRAKNLHHTDLLSQIVADHAGARLGGGRGLAAAPPARRVHDRRPAHGAGAEPRPTRPRRPRRGRPVLRPARRAPRRDGPAPFISATMTTDTESTVASATTTNPWVPLVVVMASTIMVVLDSTIVNVALHEIGVDLGAGDGIEWIVTAYLLAVCISQPATGWLADRFGRRRVFLTSLVAFTLASAACAVAPTLGVLILCRVLQGLGGGALMPVGMTMVFEMFPRRQHGRAIAVWGMAAMVAPAIGPTLGGWLVTSFSWHWIFLINVPIGIAALIAGIRLLPDIGHREARPFDGLGLALGGGGLAVIILGIARDRAGDGPRRRRPAASWPAPPCWPCSCVTSCAAPTRCSSCACSSSARSGWR